jgi:hypothetical protein
LTPLQAMVDFFIDYFYNDPSSSCATDFPQALQRWAPLKSGSPQEEQ